MDPALQADAPEAEARTAGGGLSAPRVNIDGIHFTGFVPPDPVGDIGPNHYVQMANAVFAIYNRSGILLAGPTSISSLWTAAGDTTGPCATQNRGDPVVLYDQLAGRWLMSQFAFHSYVCIAISRTANPVSDGWYVYTFDVREFPDYFKLGVWPDAYYMAANFDFNLQVTAVAFDRTNMLNGNPATFVQFNVAGLPGLDGSMLLPSDLDGPAPPPTAAPNVFYRQVDGDVFGGMDRLELFEFHVDWSNPASSSFTGPTNLVMAPFDSDLCGFFSFSCIPQPGTQVRLDPINEWPMWRLQYRNFGTHETLVGNFTVDVDGHDHAGIRWFELRKTGGAWTVYQQGTYAPQAPGAAWQHRWIGSIAMDRAGNIALGYSVSSSDGVFPSIRYAGRLATDRLGRLPRGEQTLVNGAGSSTFVRWGDYSSMNVDPSNDCTFWYTNEYFLTIGIQWLTRIGSFQFPTCSQ